MSEETNERYVLEIGSNVVWIHEMPQNEMIEEFTGPDRLLAATAELNRLNATEETGGGNWKPLVPRRPSEEEYGTLPVLDPTAFLAETLPALARQQRLEGQLIQAGEIFDQAVNEVAKWSKILNDATGTIGRIEEALARPLSEPLAAQKGSEVGQDTLIAQGLLKAFEPIERALFKPQPY